MNSCPVTTNSQYDNVCIISIGCDIRDITVLHLITEQKNNVRLFFPFTQIHLPSGSMRIYNANTASK